MSRHREGLGTAARAITCVLHEGDAVYLSGAECSCMSFLDTASCFTLWRREMGEKGLVTWRWYG